MMMIADTSDKRSVCRTSTETAPTLQAAMGMGGGNIPVIILDMTHANDVVRVYEDGTTPTLQCRMGTGGNQVPLVMAFDGYNGQISDVEPTLGVNCGMSTGRGGVLIAKSDDKRYIGHIADHTTPKISEGGVAYTLDARDYKGAQVVVLNDQGGGQMSVTKDKTATLRAQEHGHQPIVFIERAGKPGGGKGILINTEKVNCLSTQQRINVCYEKSVHGK